MKIVILEDYPERLQNVVEQLKHTYTGNEVEVVVYDIQDKYKDKVNELRDTLSYDITIANYWNLEEILDELYNEPSTLFLFDTDIDNGRIIEVFEERKNVRYALSKQSSSDDKPYRIWFYSTVDHLYHAIQRFFGDYVIPIGECGVLLDLRINECPTLCKALEMD